MLNHVLCYKANPSSAKVQMFGAIQNLSRVKKEHTWKMSHFESQTKHFVLGVNSRPSNFEPVEPLRERMWSQTHTDDWQRWVAVMAYPLATEKWMDSMMRTPPVGFVCDTKMKPDRVSSPYPVICLSDCGMDNFRLCQVGMSKSGQLKTCSYLAWRTQTFCWERRTHLGPPNR